MPLPAILPEPGLGDTVADIIRKAQPKRISAFSLVGLVVLVLGTAFQWLLIELGQSSLTSYLWQAVFSIELSFALNRMLTWRDRKINLAGSLLKWNAQKFALTVPNVLAYYWLISLGLNWLAANLLLTAVFTVINYVGGNVWSFRSIRLAQHRASGKVVTQVASAAEGQVPALPVGVLPDVSIVIPAKQSQRTIRETIDSLLAQDYPALAEIIVVADVGDPTWLPIAEVADPRLIRIEYAEIPGKREPAIKRDVGLRRARGELLALVDSDIKMDRDWLSRAVALLVAQRGGVVCGGMRSADDTFWGRFVDGNSLAAKTPRVPRSYKVTARNFGKYGRKPPITANAVMTRAVYDSCPMDDAWAFGYEDYEWFWRIASAGHQILYAAGLTGAHHHRRSFRALCREYKISADGCAEFIRAYPDSPLSRKRRKQALVLPLAALAGLLCAAAAIRMDYAMPVAALAILGGVAITGREALRARRVEAVAYPVAGVALASLFTFGLTWRLAVGRSGVDVSRVTFASFPLTEEAPELPADADVTGRADEDFRLWAEEARALTDRPDAAQLDPDLSPAAVGTAAVGTAAVGTAAVGTAVIGTAVADGPAATLTMPAVDRDLAGPGNPDPDRAGRRRQLIWIGAFAGLLLAAALLRFWQLASKPDWQFDEAIYWNIARNLQLHGTLNEKITYGAPWLPFMYQPPIYLIALARWFALTGTSIYHARILGVVCSLGSLTLLWRLAWRLNGPQSALFMIAPVALDGWLLFVQRVSYIENVTLLLVIAGMLLYQRALDSPSTARFLVAGLVVGLSVAVKYTGLYAIIAVLLCWAILRRDRNGHLILLGAAAGVLVAEQIGLLVLFDVPGHDWFINQSATQLGRVLGVGVSRGTLGSPLELVHLLFAQYKVFLPSFAVAVVAFAIVAVRLVRCYRQRSMATLRPQALFYSWATAGILVFGFSSLRYQQYFALVLVPLYCICWIEVWNWSVRFDRAVKLALVGVAIIAGLTSFWLRVGSQSDNVFAQVQQYAATSIPPHAVVVADESVGDLIGQPYCQEQASARCLWHASYVITWNTYLQSTYKLGDPAFHFMMRDATRVWSRTGFNGTITVWRLQS